MAASIPSIDALHHAAIADACQVGMIRDAVPGNQPRQGAHRLQRPQVLLRKHRPAKKSIVAQRRQQQLLDRESVLRWFANHDRMISASSTATA